MSDMATSSFGALREPASLVETDSQPKWYAIYTAANHEKRVRDQLDQRMIQSFLPLYESVRRWKDRKVRLQLPLFRSYVFARVALRERLQVLQIPGVARFVGFDGCPYALQESEVEALQRIAPCGFHAEPHPYLTKGRRVRVKDGPLAGIEGILVRKKNGGRFVISVDLIMRSVAFEVDALDLESTEVTLTPRPGSLST